MKNSRIKQINWHSNTNFIFLHFQHEIEFISKRSMLLSTLVEFQQKKSLIEDYIYIFLVFIYLSFICLKYKKIR